MFIRPERMADIPAIRDLIAAAFGRADESELVDRLRDDDDAVVSAVAEEQGLIIGHVMLSRMIAPFRALGLAPVAVSPTWQLGTVEYAPAFDALR